MSIASSQPAEITLVDTLRFAWQGRWFVLGGAVAGLLLAFAGTFLLPSTINRTVTLAVYPSGVPTDTAEDIEAQLAALLARNSFTPVQSRTGSSLTISMPYAATDLGNADGKFMILAKLVADYRVRLLAKVSGAYFDLQQREGAEGRAETLVRFRSFQDGIKDGSIDPVRITATEKDSRSVHAVLLLVAGAFIGAMAGVGFAYLRQAGTRSQ